MGAADFDANITIKLLQDVTSQAGAMVNSLKQIQSQVRAVGPVGTAAFGTLSNAVSGFRNVISNTAGIVTSVVGGMVRIFERLALMGGLSVAGVVYMAKEWAAATVEMMQTAEMLGLTTERLRGLQYAASATGVSGARLNVALMMMNKEVLQLQRTGKGPIIEFLRQVGDYALIERFRAAKTELEQLNIVMDTIRKQSPEQASAFAALFGGARYGGQVFLRLAHENVAALQEEWKALYGPPDLLVAADNAAWAYHLQVTKLSAAWEGMKDTIFSKVMPVVTEKLKWLTDWIADPKNREWVTTETTDALNLAGGLLGEIKKLVSWIGEYNWSSLGEGMKTAFGWVGDIVVGLDRAIAGIRVFDAYAARNKGPKQREEYDRARLAMADAMGVPQSERPAWMQAMRPTALTAAQKSENQVDLVGRVVVGGPPLNRKWAYNPNTQQNEQGTPDQVSAWAAQTAKAQGTSIPLADQAINKAWQWLSDLKPTLPGGLPSILHNYLHPDKPVGPSSFSDLFGMSAHAAEREGGPTGLAPGGAMEELRKRTDWLNKTGGPPSGATGSWNNRLPTDLTEGGFGKFASGLMRSFEHYMPAVDSVLDLMSEGFLGPVAGAFAGQRDMLAPIPRSWPYGGSGDWGGGAPPSAGAPSPFVGISIAPPTSTPTPDAGPGGGSALYGYLKSAIESIYGAGLPAAAGANAPMTGRPPAGITIQAEGPTVNISQAPPNVNVSVVVNVAQASDAPDAIKDQVSESIRLATTRALYDIPV